MPNVRLTRLEAVNRVLRQGLGVLPIVTLTEPLPPDAIAARDKLDDVQRDLQAEGWDMNQEDHVDLTPDGDGFIFLPVNAIRVKYSREHRGLTNLVPRGGRLYDETNGTYVFDRDVEVELVRLLDFEDLEYHLQRYIVARAAREVSGEVLGDTPRARQLAASEQLALAAARRADNDSARYNVLNAPTSSNIASRNRPS